MNKSIAKVVVGLPVPGPFDYRVPKEMQSQIDVGTRVAVSFGPRKRVGFVVAFAPRSYVKKLKSIHSILDQYPILDKGHLSFTKTFSQYYGGSWGEAIETSLPVSLRRLTKSDVLPKKSKQKKAVKQEFVLLQDLSRDKKWPVLLKKIKQCRKNNKGVMLLTPEVFSINNIASRLKKELREHPVILDKKLTSKKELNVWQALKTGRAGIVIGTRSAVFAPVQNLGLIIVLDEDNTAYKQEQSPFYHTRDVVLMRANLTGCSVIFESLTPSVELWDMAKRKKIKLMTLKENHKNVVQPIDLSNYKIRRSRISFPLQTDIQKTLEQGARAVLFMNRRGFSTQTRCNQCGFVIKCERCDIPLMYLYSKKKMVCRLCNVATKSLSKCPECKSTYLRSSGLGVEKLESEVARLFPQAKVEHYDKDTQALPRNYDILIATQALLKHHDFSASLVAMIRADSELNRIDFRSGQKTFSLLMHLAQMAKEKFVVQTHLFDNYCIKATYKRDVALFYKEELQLRKELGYPPFRHLIHIGIRAKKEETALDYANRIFETLNKKKSKALDVFEPQPDIPPKLRDQYRFMIIVTGKSVKTLLKCVNDVLKSYRSKGGVIVTINPDYSPTEFLKGT